VTNEDLYIICIQKTKIEMINSNTCFGVCENSNVNWRYTIAKNKEGGISSIWNT